MNTLKRFRQLCLVGGLSYVLIFATGIYANFGVLESLKVPGDATATLAAFHEHTEDLNRAVLAFIIMVAADLVLTFVLYRLFASVHPKRAVNAAFFRLINCIFFALALRSLMEAVPFAEQGTDPAAFAAALHDFEQTWLVGLLSFGLHLIVLSCLLRQSGYVSRIISSLLFIAGVGYCIDSTLHLVISDYSQYAEISTLVVVLPGVAGELALTFWLLAHGFGMGNTTRLKKGMNHP